MKYNFILEKITISFFILVMLIGGVVATAISDSNAYFTSDMYVNGDIFGGFLDRYSSGNFVGSLYASGANSTGSESNSLFQIKSDTRGTPQFQVQDGGPFQASFITRSFMVVNQNNTLLNSSQNGDCRDWGFIHADCNTATTGADFGVTDDIEAQGLVYADQGLRAHSSDYGSYLVVGDRDMLYSGLNGYFNKTTNIFCDYVSNNFIGRDGQWLLIRDELSDYNEARADINSLINSSCVELENNPAWDDDFGSVTWVMTGGVNSIFQKGGFFEYYVGNHEQSRYKVKINNGTGSKAVYIDDVTGTDQHQAFSIDMDIKTFDGTTGHNIQMYSSTGVDGISSSVLSLQGDATGYNNTDLNFIEANFVGEGINNTVDILHINGEVNHLIHQGSSDILSNGYVESSDETVNFNTEGTGITLFENDNDFVYIAGCSVDGTSCNFTSISFSLLVESGRDLDLEYFYCDNTGNWKTLTGVTDSTSGMRSSGTIHFANPADRGTCNKEFDGTPFDNTTSAAYIGIQRTRNNVNILPTENLISVSGATLYFTLSSSTLNLHGISDPEPCDGNTAGAIYFDIDDSKHYGCDGSIWNALY